MVSHALFDTTVLISAFLKPAGLARVLLEAARQQRYPCTLSADIIAEVERALAYPHIQERYRYSADDITEFCEALRASFPLVLPAPAVTGISRDPGDDVILACAIAAKATHLVTRDKDLLVLGTYEGMTILSPEAFITILRASNRLS
jgi:putative PIN family toxin of toxin-antitoxin system